MYKTKTVKSALGRSRTCDPGVISTMLYRLSYESLHYIQEREEEYYNNNTNKQTNKENK